MYSQRETDMAMRRIALSRCASNSQASRLGLGAVLEPSTMALTPHEGALEELRSSELGGLNDRLLHEQYPSLLQAGDVSRASGGQGFVLQQGASSEEEPEQNLRKIPQFLYKLINIMEDDRNSDIIEWSDGEIRILKVERFEKEVLSRYFSHAKLESFQRQLNYFGFHKASGFGKFTPCVYTNDATTSDIKSLLTIKRQTRNSKATKAKAAAAATKRAPNPILPNEEVVVSTPMLNHWRHQNHLLQQQQQDHQIALNAMAAARREEQALHQYHMARQYTMMAPFPTLEGQRRLLQELAVANAPRLHPSIYY